MNITRKNNTLEVIFFCLFCVSTILLSIFHEPWFDELQAWAISKDSIPNILFFLPHYEGHPPLWHLILKCFSFFDVHPEVGLRIPNLLFMYGAILLFMFKSPFPRIIKILLPFTYFLFYQYTIISRPYSILCFALFLVAFLYKTRDKYPFKFISSLALLSLSSAYGMVLAASITITWGLELLFKSKQGIISFFKSFIKDKIFFAMFSLFIFCLAICFIIAPAKDVLALNFVTVPDFVVKFFYSLGGIIADATVFDFLNYQRTVAVFDVHFSSYFIPSKFEEVNSLILTYWSSILIGIVINCILFNIFKKLNNLLLFTVPYLSILATIWLLYVCIHHVGLIYLFLIFAFWCVLSEQTEKIDWKKEKAFMLFLYAFFAVQLYWTFSACIMEIKYQYSPARELYSYIKEHNLDKLEKIMSGGFAYLVYLDKETKKRPIEHPARVGYSLYLDDEDFKKQYTAVPFVNFDHQWVAVVLNPYFDENKFYNFNVLNPEREYIFHEKPSDEKNNKIKPILQKRGLPDCIIGYSSLDLIFDESEVLARNYREMKNFGSSQIWKANLNDTDVPIFLRSDLYYEWVKNKNEKHN